MFHIHNYEVQLLNAGLSNRGGGLFSVSLLMPQQGDTYFFLVVASNLMSIV